MTQENKNSKLLNLGEILKYIYQHREQKVAGRIIQFRLRNKHLIMYVNVNRRHYSLVIRGIIYARMFRSSLTRRRHVTKTKVILSLGYTLTIIHRLSKMLVIYAQLWSLRYKGNLSLPLLLISSLWIKALNTHTHINTQNKFIS